MFILSFNIDITRYKSTIFLLFNIHIHFYISNIQTDTPLVWALFVFMSHSLQSFGSWGNLKELTLDLELFVQFLATQNTIAFLWSSLWTWISRANSDVTSFISDNSPTIFPTAPRLWRLKNSDFNIPKSPQCLVQLVWNFRICFFYT